MEMKYKQAI